MLFSSDRNATYASIEPICSSKHRDTDVAGSEYRCVAGYLFHAPVPFSCFASIESLSVGTRFQEVGNAISMNEYLRRTVEF